MDKEKLIKGAIWLSVTALTIMIDAGLFYIGFNNVEHGSYTIITIAFLLLPFIFLFAFKGIKSILAAIFY
tara:strand:- start:132 stop:341 length:210 start_codon:yes stop_codon:yes gene_type:complete